MTTFTVDLKGGSPWGFRITGGREFDEPITVSKINPNSKAYIEGLKVGDVLVEINQLKTHGLNYADAQQLIKNATQSLQLRVSSRGPSAPNQHIANGGVPRASISPSKPQRVDTGQDLNPGCLTPLPPTAADVSTDPTTHNTKPDLPRQAFNPYLERGEGLLKVFEAATPDWKDQDDLTFNPNADFGTDISDTSSTSSNSTSTTSDSYIPSPVSDMNNHSNYNGNHNGAIANSNVLDTYFDLDSYEGRKKAPCKICTSSSPFI